MGPSALLRKMTPASVLQPLSYLTIIWATILDYVFYDDLPDLPTVMGALIIAGSGIFTISTANACGPVGTRRALPSACLSEEHE